MIINTSSGTAFLVRVESSPTDPFLPAPRELVLSTFGTDGTLGSPTRIANLAAGQDMYVAAAPRADGVAVVWSDVGTGALAFAAFDAAGQTVIIPRQIVAGTSGTMGGDLRIARGGDGAFAVAYERQMGTGRYELSLVGLDADGNARAAPRVLEPAGQTYVNQGTEIVAAHDGSGYALIWRDAAFPRGRVVFSKTNLAGDESAPPHPISVTNQAGVLVGLPRLALLARPSGYLAAWTESDLGDITTSSGASSVVRLARLDSTGTALGAPAPLRAAEEDVDEVEPSLVAFKDVVAVLWGRSRHIYFCAGCIPNNRIDVLPLDPIDLVPLGPVTTIEPVAAPDAGTTAGGLLYRSVVALGSSILTGFNVTFHVHHTSASATFICDE